MRKLVTIQKVLEIIPITDSDNLEIAKILGWQTVTKKGQFKKGDYCVWFEVDSFLPLEKKYEFLRKSCYKNIETLGEGLRLRTIKLRKTLSQGLAMTLEDMDIYKESDSIWKYSNEISNQYYIYPDINEDLSRIFNVIKYEPPIPIQLNGIVKGGFPSFIPKTDQERIQNIIETRKEDIFGDDLWFEITMKLDGTSATFYKFENNVGVCSRNFDLSLDDVTSSYVRFSKETGIFNMIPDGFAIQGELMGPGIQKNRERLNKTNLFIFDVYDINNKRYLTPKERHIFCASNMVSKVTEIRHVPVLEYNYSLSFEGRNEPLESILKWVDEERSFNNDILEGLVYKRNDGKFSFKVISNKFLMEEE